MPRTFLVRRTALQLNTPSSAESEEDCEINYSEPSVNQNTGMFISYLFMHVNDPYYLNINILNFFPLKNSIILIFIILYRLVNKSFDKNRYLSVFMSSTPVFYMRLVSIPVTDKLIINHSHLCQNNSWSSNQITTQRRHVY